ncbi:hypothetical protein [Nocardia carnea]|uniref:hypothetical protein n=1 Tax=Nocardia carnea TaxID=37328 RepID=UPI0024576658|nr:hypothetical protein [Nocardia carnea]
MSARSVKVRPAGGKKFDRVIDPDGLLRPDERAYLAEHARRVRRSARIQRRRTEYRRNGGDY